MKALIRNFFSLTLMVFVTGCSMDGCSLSDLNSVEIAGKPCFSVIKGTNYQVRISSATEGAVIKYTTDMTDPSTSETAIEYTSETELKINMLSTVKAFAAKEGLQNSPVINFRLPTFKNRKNVTYDTDTVIPDSYGNVYGPVTGYVTSGYDCNDRLVKQVWYKSEGDDERWFTCDDVPDYFILYEYDDEGILAKQCRYDSADLDGIWFTGDDGIESYFEYVYDANNLIRKEKFDGDGIIQSYENFNYTGEALTGTETFNDPGADGVLGVSDGPGPDGQLGTDDDPKTEEDDVMGSSFSFEYADDLLSKKTMLNSSGEITMYTEYDYTNRILSELKLATDSGDDTEWGTGDDTVKTTSYSSTDNAIYNYTYEYDKDNEDKLTRVERYLQFGTDSGSLDAAWAYEYVDDKKTRETKYKNGKTETVESYITFEYDSENDDRLSKKNCYDKEDTLLSYVDFKYDEEDLCIKEIKHVQPDAGSMNITWNLSIKAKGKEEGYYTIHGKNYKTDGSPIGDLTDLSPDADDFPDIIMDKIKTIVNSATHSETGTSVSGAEGGSCLITYNLNIDDKTAKIRFNFESFSDGDIIINGTIVKDLSVLITINGEELECVTADGTFTGSLTITDAAPVFEEADFSTDSYTVNEYDGDDSLVTKRTFIDPGADGIWKTDDETSGDDTPGQYTVFAYSDNNQIETETVYESDDTVSHFFTYEYDTEGNPVKKFMLSDYGKLSVETNSDGKISSSFEYLEKELFSF